MAKTFKSYVNFRKDDTERELADLAQKTPYIKLHTDLLPGEIVIAECQSVLKFNNYTERKQGVSGALFVTNFKISFVSMDKAAQQKEVNHERNLLLAEDDISLNCVESIYQVSKGRKKKLLPGAGISGRVKKIDIYCKDFRTYRFSFKFVRNKGDEKKVVNAVVHHTNPSKVELMFAFEYAGLTENLCKGTEYDTCLYESTSDWENEMQRLKCSEQWRVTDINRRFEISFNLPEYFVIPSTLLNKDIKNAAPQFVENRVLTWSYTHSSGASLVRLAALRLESEQRKYEDSLLESVKSVHPSKRPVQEFDITKECPSVKDIQASHEKLKELCMPGSLKDCQTTDGGWYSSLENTRWLLHVGQCLLATEKVLQLMCEAKRSVALRESTGCDFSCVVSSLVQICLDPHFRTFQGFQSLIQREFVKMGFHFLDRCGHVPNKFEESPVFLLFLDCVWQLLRQYPPSFAFTETYLTSLWDSVHIGVFGTFLFSNPGDKNSACKDRKGSAFLELWDWKRQFNEENLSLFRNPLYTGNEVVRRKVSAVNGIVTDSTITETEAQKLYSRHLHDMFREISTHEQEAILKPLNSAGCVEFWSQCFLRWLFPVQIINGGSPSEYFQQCLLVEEIVQLQVKLHSLEAKPEGSYRRTRHSSDLFFGLDTPHVSHLLDSKVVTSSFPFSSAQNQAVFLASPLRLFVRQSEVLNDLECSSTFEDSNNISSKVVNKGSGDTQ